MKIYVMGESKVLSKSPRRHTILRCCLATSIRVLASHISAPSLSLFFSFFPSFLYSSPHFCFAQPPNIEVSARPLVFRSFDFAVHLTPFTPRSLECSVVYAATPMPSRSSIYIKAETPPRDIHEMSESHQSTAPQKSNGLNCATWDSEMQETNGAQDAHPNGDLEMASDAMQSIAQDSRRLIGFIRKLEALRIESTLKSVPRFVVVGDQSHGKSSIIEAACDIKLPRSAGTCTRCPFEITTSSSTQPWQCRVALLRQWETDRRAASSQSVKWKDSGRQNELEFARFSNKDELGHILRLAQMAILNPSLDAIDIRDSDGLNVRTSLPFSPNTISIEVSGPGLVELSLVDLPGSINVAPDEDEQYLVEFIEKLMKRYIREEKTLVLLAASADQDLDNSTAFRHVRTCKALPRTMGVLTKPDLLSKARLPFLISVLKGEKFQLGNGWFVTKNLSQEELDEERTWSQARELEEQFFSHAPWSEVRDAFPECFGTPMVQEAISKLLTGHIVAELPEIQQRVETRIDAIFKELRQFPEKPLAPCITVDQEAQKLASLVEKRIESRDFRRRLKAEAMLPFKKALEQAKPVHDLETPGYIKPTISVDDTSGAELETPSKRAKGNSGQSFARVSAATSTPRSTAKKSQGPPQGQSGPQKLTLEKISREHDSSSASELKSGSHEVRDDLIRASLATWPSLKDSAFRKATNAVVSMARECIEECLASRWDTQLRVRILAISTQLCNELSSNEKKFVDHMTECEMLRPIMWNPMLNVCFKETSTVLEKKRLEKRVDEMWDDREAYNKEKVPQGLDRYKKSSDLQWQKDNLVEEKFKAELEMLVQVLVYYDLASVRMLENFTTHIECGLLHAMKTQLCMRLRTELCTNDEEYCAQLLAEDPEREVMRIKLLTEKDKLEKALEDLQNLPHRNGSK